MGVKFQHKFWRRHIQTTVATSSACPLEKMPFSPGWLLHFRAGHCLLHSLVFQFLFSGGSHWLLVGWCLCLANFSLWSTVLSLGEKGSKVHGNNIILQTWALGSSWQIVEKFWVGQAPWCSIVLKLAVEKFWVGQAPWCSIVLKLAVGFLLSFDI
jgi:hypothetical protein